jgi:hypothetical protein
MHRPDVEIYQKLGALRQHARALTQGNVKVSFTLLF